MARRGSLDWLAEQLDRIDHHERGIREYVTADCGFCGLTPPDKFGNRDLLEHPDCPWHAGVAD